MRLFKCQVCGQTLFFENSRCEHCGHALGYMARQGRMISLEPHEGVYLPAGASRGRLRYCENARHGVCNWLVPLRHPGRFCQACRHNRTIPDLKIPANLPLWQRVEHAKHRLIYTLLALGINPRTRAEDPAGGLAFDFLADPPAPGKRVLTGHENGLITINLSEADDAWREKTRAAMGEPYRTLLGHFRHESGHYAWNLLIAGTARLAECRALFGDDRADYGAALAAHYRNGPPPGWQNGFISAYATTHPWEDFAESWAHYLHIVDTLETASAFGLRIHPASTNAQSLHADIDFDPHRAPDIGRIITAWLPLTFAVNSLNRSLGQPDLYPFVLNAKVIEKLGFIHETLREHRAAAVA